jgi:DNA-binding beta-propeller fold protein YncE
MGQLLALFVPSRVIPIVRRLTMNRATSCFTALICAGIVALSHSDVLAEPGGSVLQLEAKIPLGNVTGRIDHMAADLARHRLFVAELGNDTVGVVDFDAQKVVHRIAGLKEPQGVAYIQMNDSLYVANGGDGSVPVFSGPDYSPSGRIDLGADADNIRVDAASGQLFVGYGKGGIGVIDPRSKSKIKGFALKAHPESFQLDPTKRRLFVNLPSVRAIAVLDASTGQEQASWPLRHGGNFPMALDHERQLALVVFRNPAKFAAFNLDTGSLAAEVDTCGDADDVFIDAKRQRVYITCGAGFIDVLKADDPKYSRVVQIPTVTGARTGLFIPEMDRLFLAVRAQAETPAAIWIYRTPD